MLSDPNHLPYLLQIFLLFNKNTDIAKAPSNVIFYQSYFHVSDPPVNAENLLLL